MDRIYNLARLVKGPGYNSLVPDQFKATFDAGSECFQIGIFNPSIGLDAPWLSLLLFWQSHLLGC